MTNEELRVACAEAREWTEIECDFWGVPPGKNRVDMALIPNFPTDHNTAMTLCDALGEKGWQWRASIEDTHSEVCFQFVNDEFTFEATGPTLPIAICRAYLSVIQSQTPTT